MSVGERLELHVSRRRIASAVKRLARQIEADYPEELPVMVGILTGSFVFMADLVRELQREVELEFMRVSSYGSGTSIPREMVKLRHGRLRQGARHGTRSSSRTSWTAGRDHLLRGASTCRRRGAASVKVCALLDKPSRRDAAHRPGLRGLQRAGPVSGGIRPGLRRAGFVRCRTSTSFREALMDLSRLIRVARGDAEADAVFTNARIVNTFTGEIEEGNVAVAEGRVAGIGDYTDGQARPWTWAATVPGARVHRRPLPPGEHVLARRPVRACRGAKRHAGRRHRPA